MPGGLISNFKIPEVNNCCGCVNDIKTAAAIIAVLGIVTSPLVSWAVVRHAYVIRVSCFVSASSSRPDVVDINLSNVLSFGFGANAGLGPSCLIKNSTKVLRADEETENKDDMKHSEFVKTVRCVGWIVLIADFIFLLLSINLLIKMATGNGQIAARYFISSGLISIIMSFIYGMLYVSACVYMGGSFPVFEFVFALVDLMMWSYFLIVVYSYRQKAS
ncbi:uncharacterized protein LOC123694994 [Colias croceus]|uniref:uncharacterized protein LOC123694994 n=1 Tax=Colias crocea TaxID=72248 RepID=UPI001E27F8CA|nr:uncharacterized protein LOC123694994 [Colias croceus]CAG4945489.1 unnamed protein product [Colias eurytheme]